MQKKAWSLALGLLVAAAVLSLFKPVRTWASEEGSYIYHQLALNGPAYIYAGTTYTNAAGTALKGLIVDSGTPASPVTLKQRLLGAMTSANRPGSPVEGSFIYDTTIHSIAFYDGTGWHKLVTGSGANDNWTTY